MPSSATGLSYLNYKKLNPTATVQQWIKAPPSTPSSVPVVKTPVAPTPIEKAREFSGSSPVPSPNNPVISSSPKTVTPPKPKYLDENGNNLIKNATVGMPSGNYYNNDQVKAIKGNLSTDLTKEGFTDEELMKLANTGDINKALGYFSGIKNTTNAEGGQFLEQLDPLSNSNYSEILAKARGDKKIEKINQDLSKTEDQIKSDINSKYAPEYTKIKESSEKARETDLRLAGRSAFGSATGERQTEITDKEKEINQGIAAQQRLEQQQQIALARGASQSEIDGINNQIQSISDKRAQMQADLDLQNAGLDEQAVSMADEREKQVFKDSLEAAKSGLMWDNETGKYVKDPSMANADPADFDIQFQTDNTGNVTQVRTNKQTGEVITNALGQIGKGEVTGASKYQLQFNPLTGDQVIFDPSTGNAFNMDSPEPMFFGGSTAYDPVTQEETDNSAFVESTPTSDSKGIQVLGDGGGLGGNCVLYARTKNPSLPYGLFDKNDKINAIAKAGSKDWNQLKAGDTILSGEGSVGHAMTAIGFNPKTGKVIVEEANYTPGKVTKGREISVNDPLFYGFVPNKGREGSPPILKEDYQNEGQNAPITTQVQQASGKPMEAGIIAMAAQMGIDINDKTKRALILDNFRRYGILPQADPDKAYQKEKDAQDDWYKQMNLQLQMQGNDRQISQNDFQNADKLRTDFDSQAAVKDFKDVQTTRNEFNNIIKSGVQGPADVSLVFKFMKALDPTSVVKQDEFDKAANSSGQFTLGTIWSKFNGKFKNGRFLSDDVRNDFLKLVDQSFAAKQKSYNQELQRYQGISTAYGLDPSKVIFNYDQSTGANTSSPFSSSAPSSVFPSSAPQQVPGGGLFNKIFGGSSPSAPKPAPAPAPVQAKPVAKSASSSLFSKIFG